MNEEQPYAYRCVVEASLSEGRYVPPLYMITYDGNELDVIRTEDGRFVQKIVSFLNEAYNKGRDAQIKRSRNFSVVHEDMDSFNFD